MRLEPATEQRLDQLAQLIGRTKGFDLRQLIAAGLDDLEDVVNKLGLDPAALGATGAECLRSFYHPQAYHVHQRNDI